MSSKIKLGMLSIVAALAFLGLGRAIDSASADVILGSGPGDVCFIGANAGNQTNGEVHIPVSQIHFDVLARIQDAFYLPLAISLSEGEDDAPDFLSIDVREGDLPNVDPLFLSASIDGHSGEAKIVDRIEDHSLNLSEAALSTRFPFIPFAGINWQWPEPGTGLIAAIIFMFGVASENDIPPVNTVNALDVLTELAGGGGDIDSTNNDIQEFFVNRAGMRSDFDQTVAQGALENCGLPILSGSSRITAGNMNAVWMNLLLCLTVGDAGACDDILETLDVDAGETVNLNINLDGWSQISVHCFKPGQVKITFDPTTWLDWQGQRPASQKEGASLEVECIGAATNATASASPTTVEIFPVGTSVSLSTITVIVTDQNGRRVDGVPVTFSTDRCRLGTSSTGPFSGTTVSTVSDTDTTSDTGFVNANVAPGGELFAGTAEAYLQCDVGGATPGTATVTWVVQGGITGTGFAQVATQALTGTVTVTVIGPPATLALALNPTTATCGSPIVATATVKDAFGQNVSDGTPVFFTTTTATGVQGGVEGAQGQALTIGGVATVTLSVDPMDAGTHTVSARTGGTDLSGSAIAQISDVETFTCSAVAAAAAPAAPSTVTAPRTGQGPSIAPPNTGDAGLAAGSSSSFGFFAIGVVVLALASVASFRFARR